MKNLLIGPWDLLVDDRTSSHGSMNLLFYFVSLVLVTEVTPATRLHSQPEDWVLVLWRSPRKMCFHIYGVAFDLYGKWPAPTLGLLERSRRCDHVRSNTQTHWRYERLKEKNGWMFENALRRPKYVIEKNGWMFENALRRPKYVIESPEYRFETTQCNSLINSWNRSANWQVRRSGVPDRYHHGKAVSSLVDDCQTMHPPPAELIDKQDRSACDSGFHTHIGPKRGDVSIYQHELATIRRFANRNENSGTF